jgi:uncharacterized glyoxalase superfamily protein PhnB
MPWPASAPISASPGSLIGTDAAESTGFTLTQGNGQAMFWGGYFGILVDRFGIRWMVNGAEAS